MSALLKMKYLRIPFIKPNKPFVPAGAIGELRIDKVAT